LEENAPRQAYQDKPKSPTNLLRGRSSTEQRDKNLRPTNSKPHVRAPGATPYALPGEDGNAGLRATRFGRISRGRAGGFRVGVGTLRQMPALAYLTRGSIQTWGKASRHPATRGGFITPRRFPAGGQRATLARGPHRASCRSPTSERSFPFQVWPDTRQCSSPRKRELPKPVARERRLDAALLRNCCLRMFV